MENVKGGVKNGRDKGGIKDVFISVCVDFGDTLDYA